MDIVTAKKKRTTPEIKLADDKNEYNRELTFASNHGSVTEISTCPNEPLSEIQSDIVSQGTSEACSTMDIDKRFSTTASFLLSMESSMGGYEVDDEEESWYSSGSDTSFDEEDESDDDSLWQQENQANNGFDMGTSRIMKFLCFQTEKSRKGFLISDAVHDDDIIYFEQSLQEDVNLAKEERTLVRPQKKISKQKKVASMQPKTGYELHQTIQSTDNVFEDDGSKSNKKNDESLVEQSNVSTRCPVVQKKSNEVSPLSTVSSHGSLAGRRSEEDDVISMKNKEEPLKCIEEAELATSIPDAMDDIQQALILSEKILPAEKQKEGFSMVLAQEEESKKADNNVLEVSRQCFLPILKAPTLPDFFCFSGAITAPATEDTQPSDEPQKMTMDEANEENIDPVVEMYPDICEPETDIVLQTTTVKVSRKDFIQCKKSQSIDSNACRQVENPFSSDETTKEDKATKLEQCVAANEASAALSSKESNDQSRIQKFVDTFGTSSEIGKTPEECHPVKETLPTTKTTTLPPLLTPPCTNLNVRNRRVDRLNSIKAGKAGKVRKLPPSEAKQDSNHHERSQIIFATETKMKSLEVVAPEPTPILNREVNPRVYPKMRVMRNSKALRIQHQHLRWRAAREM